MTIPSDLPYVIKLGILAILIVSVPVLLNAETVTINSGIQVAYEQGVVPATFVVSRDGNSAMTVRLSPPTGTATLTTRYSITRPGGATDLIPISGGTGGYDLQFAQGENNKILLVTPVNDGIIQLRQFVTLAIASDPGTYLPPNSPSYIIGSPNAAQVTIADNDLLLSTDTPAPIADENPAISSVIGDPALARRGIMRALFSQVFNVPRDVAARLTGTASYGSDYTVRYRICGNDGAAQPISPMIPTGSAGGTGNSSHIGYSLAAPSSGVAYQIVAHRIGQTAVFVQGSGTLASGSTIQFPNHAQVYTLTTNFTASSAGPVLVGISPALTANLTNGLAISVLTGASPMAIPTLSVSHIYPAGSISVEVANGSGGIFRGDSFVLSGSPSIHYVATNDVPGTAGTLCLEFYEEVNGAVNNTIGLAADVSATADIVTFIDPVVDSSGYFNFVFPRQSLRIEFSVEPALAAGIPTGHQTVILTLLSSEDYEIVNPTVSQVTIADRDSTVDIAVSANAGKPGTSGSFLVTLSKPFPVPLTVPYQVSGSAVPGPTSNGTTNDYVALTSGAIAVPYSGSLTIPAGQTSGFIPIVPALKSSGTTTVVVTLSSSLDYLLAGSSGSGTNPSATMSVSDSLGSVDLLATVSTAIETPTPSASTIGVVTVGITRAPSTSGAVAVNLRVTGTATYLSRYSVQSSGTPLSLVAAGAGTYTTQVSIPSGSNSVSMSVIPIDNFIADGSQTVVFQVDPGSSYTIGSSPPAVVTILDDEPKIGVSLQTNANKPSSLGYFVVSYPGVPSGTAQNHSVTVNFTLLGTAVQNTDYAAGSSVTIPSGALSALIAIAPIATPDSLDKTVIVTLSSNSGYSINQGSATMTIGHATTSSGTKPTPGTINTGGSGGCGLGSGIATLTGLGLLALRLSLVRRRRRD